MQKLAGIVREDSVRLTVHAEPDWNQSQACLSRAAAVREALDLIEGNRRRNAAYPDAARDELLFAKPLPTVENLRVLQDTIRKLETRIGCMQGAAAALFEAIALDTESEPWWKTKAVQLAANALKEAVRS